MKEKESNEGGEAQEKESGKESLGLAMRVCPACGSTNAIFDGMTMAIIHYHCLACLHRWDEDED